MVTSFYKFFIAEYEFDVYVNWNTLNDLTLRARCLAYASYGYVGY